MKKFNINELKIMTVVIFFCILFVSISLINSKAITQRNANQIKTKISSTTLNHSGATKHSNGFYASTTCPIDRNALHITATSKYNKSNIHSYPEDDNNIHVDKKHAKTICNITQFLDSSEPGSTIKPGRYQFLRVTADDYGDIPFKFPMPLQDMHNDNSIGSTHSNSKESSHLKNGVPSNTKSTQKQRTILRAILIPDNKIIEKTKVVDPSKKSIARIEEASSSHVNLSSNNNRSKGILKLQFDHQNYPISYQITGAGNKINDINVENDNTTIIAHVTSQSDGILTIQLPGDAMIDLKRAKNNQKDSFAVFEDGQYYPTYNEGQYIHGIRKVMVYFEKGTEQIEILTGHPSPEFGMTFPIAFFLYP
ncbi:MAG: hypothetical protein JO327_02680 [Nitrososphaeraceae archaeon]|nr:hypothetical protein [Nitrososphaeraceae archaeon]MBV9667015.1 hypothetical protein [Nitrososphaeraceae archaeon]